MKNNNDIPAMDWEQVRQNGGPPCFALGVDGDPKRFCGRAKRWEGHDSHHIFLSEGDITVFASELFADKQSLSNEAAALREANAMLLESLEHYADKKNWRCSKEYEDGHTCRPRYLAYACDLRKYFDEDGYDIAQAALDKHAAMQGETL